MDGSNIILRGCIGIVVRGEILQGDAGVRECFQLWNDCTEDLWRCSVDTEDGGLRGAIMDKMKELVNKF